MELDPTLHTKSMGLQLQTLIVDAFKCLSSIPQRSYLIIDGLDECPDNSAQQLILQLLCESITVHKLPLRFLIGSRLNLISAPISIANVSVTESVSMNHLIPEEIFGCFTRWVCEDLCREFHPLSWGTTMA